MVDIWVTDILSVDDARKVIKEQNLSFPIKVATSCGCICNSGEEMFIHEADFDNEINRAIELSPSGRISFLLRE